MIVLKISCKMTKMTIIQHYVCISLLKRKGICFAFKIICYNSGTKYGIKCQIFLPKLISFDRLLFSFDHLLFRAVPRQGEAPCCQLEWSFEG